METGPGDDSRKYKIRAAVFLGIVGGGATIFGFSKTLAKAKKDEMKIVETCGVKATALIEGGTSLALRALAWGTAYAIIGTGTFCYGVWKLSGAQNFQEFRHIMGKGLPRLTKDTQTSRTDFEGLNDLMKYLATWGKE